jgi:tRNA(Ile)-lysidine synthase
MMTDRFIAHHLEADDIAIIGVSGGPDSLCLLDLARQVPSLKIIVAHFNHQLRPEAKLEAEFVMGVAEGMKLPFVSDGEDVRGYALEHSLSLEEAARMLRYRFLFSQARSKHASVVAVGHTADDQVETILMHFLRGAGMAGLKGMEERTLLPEFDRKIPLARPILHLWRNETETYCREHFLKPVLDPSNRDETYFRNRLRHSLIPELEKYNPRFKNTLLRTAEALAGDYEAVNDAVDSTWKKVVAKAEPEYIAFRGADLEKIPGGLRRNILRKAIAGLRPKIRNLDFNTLERAAEFIVPKSKPATPELLPMQVDLTEGLYLYREGETIYLAALEADLPSAQWPQVEGVYELPIDGQLKLNGDFILSAVEAELETASLDAIENEDPFTGWMDADLTGNTFWVRARRAGDTFSPLGMNRQTMKMREFYINVKIPRRARGGWPLVCAGEQIVWVPGYRLAHPFRITNKTKRVVKLTLQGGNKK